MFNKLIFATGNKNKLREAREILGIKIEGVALEIDEIQSLDPEEVVRKKAIAAFTQFGKPILVEDTALFFDAWRGLPGVFINYFLKTVGNEGLLKMLGKEPNRKAQAVTTLGIYDGKVCKIYQGKIKGTVAKKPRGAHGFGWDPIFIPKGHNKTFAEMRAEEKNQLSMRKKALEKLKEFIQTKK